jgi:hypothetical protein
VNAQRPLLECRRRISAPTNTRYLPSSTIGATETAIVARGSRCRPLPRCPIGLELTLPEFLRPRTEVPAFSAARSARSRPVRWRGCVFRPRFPPDRRIQATEGDGRKRLRFPRRRLLDADCIGLYFEPNRRVSPNLRDKRPLFLVEPARNLERLYGGGRQREERFSTCAARLKRRASLFSMWRKRSSEPFAICRGGASLS